MAGEGIVKAEGWQGGKRRKRRWKRKAGGGYGEKMTEGEWGGKLVRSGEKILMGRNGIS